jgi:TrpR family transcriptional regulator, trp operon repressor
MKKTPEEVLELYRLLLKFKSTKKLEALFSDLLTPQEILSVAQRLQILKSLLRGETQRDVAHKLGISIGKVTRGSRILQFGELDWKEYFRNH